MYWNLVWRMKWINNIHEAEENQNYSYEIEWVNVPITDSTKKIAIEECFSSSAAPFRGKIASWTTVVAVDVVTFDNSVWLVVKLL